MDGKLTEDGADDIDVEDVGLGAFFGESFNRLEDGGGEGLAECVRGKGEGNVLLL